MFFKIEKAAPVFFGTIGSLILSAVLAVNEPDVFGRSGPVYPDSVEESSVKENPVLFFAEAEDENSGLIEEMYREAGTRDRVIDFFAQVCGSREIAAVVLAGAYAYNIPPALAFALGWEESRFNPKAVNAKNRNGSIDRGLFQLNSLSFPKLESHAFFDPEINAKNGMSHLRHCLNVGGTEIAALAMYNAGTGRVGSTGAPKVTLDYIHRILRSRGRIETRFKTQILAEEESLAADEAPLLAAAEKQGRSRFVPLTPLSFFFGR